MRSIAKLRWNVLIQSCAVFIVLSASVQAEPLQCYWCGPLAEQVHRSRRAPPCGDVTTPVTSCDPGYDHCAVIASSPPYTESRLCVKLYQDECYPVYCNTTKTWRMTCPCRGNLCNGPSMEREKESFAILGKLVSKTRSPIKKRSAPSELSLSEHPKHLEDNNLIQNSTPDNIVNLKADTNDIKAINDEATTGHDFVKINTPTQETIKNEINSNIVTPSLYPVNEQNNKLEDKEMKDQMQSDQAVTNDSNIKNEQPKDAYENVMNKPNKNITIPEDEKKDKNPVNHDKTKDETYHVAKEVETTTPKIQKAKTENPHMVNATKSNAKLPPAQALQQDSYPVTIEKTETTMPPTLMTETDTMTEHTTAKSLKNSKNHAVGMCLHLVLFVKWIIIYIYS